MWKILLSPISPNPLPKACTQTCTVICGFWFFYQRLCSAVASSTCVTTTTAAPAATTTTCATDADCAALPETPNCDNTLLICEA